MTASAVADRLRKIWAHIFRTSVSNHRDRILGLVRGLENSQETIWEWCRYYLQRQPSDGEITAILRRNGWPGFYPYLLKQRNGDFGRRNFAPGDREATIRTLREAHPEEVARIIAQAEKILHGEFNLLGSGPVDMRRGKAGQGHRIDWNRDPISGERYPRIFSQWRWNPFKMRRGNADVKGPWELSRCQHFPLLGQAYWLTGDERFAQCYAHTIDDFISRNRPGIGVHWACPMDVALRIVSWLAGLSYFQGSPALGALWWRRFLKSAVQHGRHITNNLEFGTLDGRIIVSNHGLANLFGLYWLSLNFSGLDAGCVWRGIAETGLEQQVRLQLLDDGGGFESSVPYHRLVTEMFLSAYALAQHHRLPLSAEYKARLVNALRFIKALRQDGGRLPQIGDADNGRAHILSGYGEWEFEQEKMDHLLVAGAAVLGCPELADGVEQKYRVEAVFWRDNCDAKPDCTALVEIDAATLFPDSGAAVLRQGRSYVLMVNSVCGTFGIGNHKHNDQLSIEWAIGNQPIFVDGGSYTYTQDPAARNWFRSTSHHNTLQVDGLEQHSMDPAALFRLAQNGSPEWGPIRRGGDGSLGIRGRDSAYQRLDGGVIHERRLLLTPDGTLVIDDMIENPEGHALRWYFLVHPSVSVKVEGYRALMTYDGGSATLEASETVAWRVEPAWYSSGYGARQETVALVTQSVSLARSTFLAFEETPGARLSHGEAVRRADSFWLDS